MRYIVLIFTFFSLVSCKNKTEFEDSKIRDINEIVQTIITEDSLNVFKNGINSRMFCEELTKLNVYVPKKSKDGVTTLPLPPSSGNISIEQLLHYKKSGFFTAKDSLQLLKQNLNSDKFKIKKNLFEKINLTTRANEKNKIKAGKSFNFYEMTIPVFSLDNQKAYVELNHYCGSLCGSGMSIYLIKVNGKWKIVDKWETWIS